jgi:hypothetical protein
MGGKEVLSGGREVIRYGEGVGVVGIGRCIKRYTGCCFGCGEGREGCCSYLVPFLPLPPSISLLVP